MKKKIEKIIGIDPDMDKSGVAILDCVNKKMIVKDLSFSELLLKTKSINKESTLIVVEAGYLNKSNWHLKKAKSKFIASEIGRRTGENHAVAKQIIRTLKDFGFHCSETRPLAKVWKNGKISHKEFVEKCANDNIIFDQRTNQEKRDAGLIALAFFKRQCMKIKK